MVFEKLCTFLVPYLSIDKIFSHSYILSFLFAHYAGSHLVYSLTIVTIKKYAYLLLQSFHQPVFSVFHSYCILKYTRNGNLFYNESVAAIVLKLRFCNVVSTISQTLSIFLGRQINFLLRWCNI